MTVATANLNDGSSAAPRLRRDLNMGNTWILPEWSEGPRGDPRAVHEAIAAAGYESVQGGDPTLAAEFGMTCTTFGILREPGSLDNHARTWADLGMECATLHVGTGLEDDDTADRYIEEVLAASEAHLPIYIETHRATLTQDIWRSVEFVKRYPELRFNGDFSHWYTGLEMTYGDFFEKLDYAMPVLERVRFFHGRIGDPGCIQVDVGEDASHPSVEHFRRFWTRACAGFLADAAPGDVLPFAPELLPAEINYARRVLGPDGQLREEGDRWRQASVLLQVAQECFDTAQLAMSGNGSGSGTDT